MMQSTFTVAPLAHIGVEIVGLDSARIGGADEDRLRALWIEHGVLLFRRVGTDAATHVRLSRIFGALQEHVIESLRVADNPDLIVLGGEGDKKGPPMRVDGELRAGFLFLHQDGAYTPSISQGGMLRMIQPPAHGGDTLWTDTQAAYAALPANLKAFCDSHATVQVWRDFPERLWGWPEIHLDAVSTDDPMPVVDHQPFPPVLQPMAIEHPVSGAKALLLSPLGYDGVWGMDRTEGDRIYEEVVRHAVEPRFCYRHHWAVNDLVLWDNRRTMHAAFGFPYAETRVVQRTTLAGDQPTGRLLTP
ncbi:TauD/TfdA family dioxygenase [Sphingomonas sp. LY54]|uniref:TauD/TfdA dioxygenase family protein n=1 Tax=Sphingomonas sp. LY54 TaxID=3095343 RepID=UPI002D78C6E4|nr:TauD/TfdA family dioxygenase [Sphingomonas sp. LY54]WRP28184.1 TauD/TfdA family dioxygenase [Sphingomonas sp. LY54]